ncbi:MAG: ATP-binding cassette domain-containing protein [Enterocloster sp.]
MAEQQMAEILKILVRDPELIILDEPTSALAKKEVEQLYQIIHNLIADGKTIIFISHRLEELFELGDRITVFKDGCYIGTRNMNEINEDDLIRMMVGRSLNHVFPPPVCEVDDSQVIFEVKDLADADHKLNQVSFQVHKGEILGVAGLQGHGQTELLNAVSGLYPPVRGIYYCQWKAGGHKERGAGHCKRNCPGALRPEEPGADAGAFQPPQPGHFQYEKAHERMFHRQKGGTGIQRVHGVKAFH